MSKFQIMLDREPTEEGYRWFVVNRPEYEQRCHNLGLTPLASFTMTWDQISDSGLDLEEAVVPAFTHGHPSFAFELWPWGP